MKVSRRASFVFLVAGGLAVAAIFFFVSSGQQAAEVEYFSAPVDRGPIRNVVNATGVVQTVVTVQVGSQVSGQIQELYADFNSIVKRGQLLAKLDPRNFEAQVQNSKASVAAAQARVRSSEAEIRTQAANLLSSRANLEAARVTRDNTSTMFDRAKELSARGVMSKNDFDTAKANYDSALARYEQARASVEQVQAQEVITAAQLEQTQAQLQQTLADLDRAQLNLEFTSIFSPVDGVVISRKVDVGQTIAASMQSPTLFEIATDLSQMQVNASVDEADIGSISDAATVRFTVDAYPNDQFRGRIVEIRLNPQTVQNVVTYSVILGIENPELKLKPGMTANISITVDQRDEALKAPNAAIRYNPPGASPEPQRGAGGRGMRGIEAPSAPAQEGRTERREAEAPALPLAPGQKWDPDDKIRFGTSRKSPVRPATVWVLNDQGQPERRRVVLGITDGAATEVVSGELKQGDPVIIGDSTQVDQTRQTGSRGILPFGFGPRGGGPRGR